MKVAVYNQRVTISASHAEFEILKRAVEKIDRQQLDDPGLRRSWARRCNIGRDGEQGTRPFLCVDKDRRTDL